MASRINGARVWRQCSRWAYEKFYFDLTLIWLPDTVFFVQWGINASWGANMVLNNILPSFICRKSTHTRWHAGRVSISRPFQWSHFEKKCTWILRGLNLFVLSLQVNFPTRTWYSVCSMQTSLLYCCWCTDVVEHLNFHCATIDVHGSVT